MGDRIDEGMPRGCAGLVGVWRMRGCRSGLSRFGVRDMLSYVWHERSVLSSLLVQDMLS